MHDVQKVGVFWHVKHLESHDKHCLNESELYVPNGQLPTQFYPSKYPIEQLKHLVSLIHVLQGALQGRHSNVFNEG